MKFVPYLIMEGCRTLEAVSFYQEVFGAELVLLQKASDMPGFASEELSNLVLHAHLRLSGGPELYLCDTFPAFQYQQGNNVTICINTEDANLSRTWFEALSVNGTITHAIEETFFSPAFGTVRDQFGVTFTISTLQPQ